MAPRAGRRARRHLSREPDRATARFGLGLAGLALLALGVRLVYALTIAPGLPARADTVLYHWLAGGLANGLGYSTPASVIAGHPVATSAYPPLYPLYLAAWSKLGLGGLDAHRAVSCLLGTAAVVLLGLLGRRLAGPRAGLVAAGIAALYPQLFMVDGTVISESLYAPILAGALLVAYKLREHPGVTWAAALGALIGLAVLTRSEALLLLVLLGVPAAWAAGAWRARAIVLAACVVGTGLVLSPWIARNWVVQHRPLVLTSNSGLTAAATNCQATYYDSRYLGFARNACALELPCRRIAAELPRAACERDSASAYAHRHLGRVPLVVAVRVARVWELYGYQTDLGYGELWSRDVTVAKIGLVVYGLLVVLGAGGLVLLRRRGVVVWPLLAPFVLVTISAALTFGFSRYRLGAEWPLVVRGGGGVAALVARVVERREARGEPRLSPAVPPRSAPVR